MFDDEMKPVYNIAGMDNIQLLLMRGVAKLLKIRGDSFGVKTGTILSFSFDVNNCFICQKRRLSASRKNLLDYVQIGIKKREGLCQCSANDSVYMDNERCNVQDFIVIAKHPKTAKFLSRRSTIFCGGPIFDILSEANLTVLRTPTETIRNSGSSSVKDLTKAFFKKHVLGLLRGPPSMIEGNERPIEAIANIVENDESESEYCSDCTSESEEAELFFSDPLLKYNEDEIHQHNHEYMLCIEKEEKIALFSALMRDVRMYNKLKISDDCEIHISTQGKYGYIHPRLTKLNPTIDDSGYFKRIHIVPFEDTLPTIYDVNNVFEEYLKPYLRANPWKRFIPGCTFWYHGSQFKVLYTEDLDNPNKQTIVVQDELTPFKVPRKIGRHTLVYTHGVAIPHWIDVLPNEMVENIRRQPTRLQSLLLLQELLRMDERDLQRFMSYPGQQKKVAEPKENKDEIFEKYVKEMTDTLYDELALSNATSEDSKAIQCMICLEDIPVNHDIFIATCDHAYHPECANHWFSHDNACPLCRNALEMESTSLN